MAELGNLTARILLRLWRKSTVKIRAGSLFCTPPARIGPTRAAFRAWPRGFFLRPPQATASCSQDVHRQQGFRLARKPLSGAKSKEENSEVVDSRMSRLEGVAKGPR